MNKVHHHQNSTFLKDDVVFSSNECFRQKTPQIVDQIPTSHSPPINDEATSSNELDPVQDLNTNGIVQTTKESTSQHVCDICGLVLSSGRAILRHEKIHLQPDLKLEEQSLDSKLGLLENGDKEKVEYGEDNPATLIMEDLCRVISSDVAPNDSFGKKESKSHGQLQKPTVLESKEKNSMDSSQLT